MFDEPREEGKVPVFYALALQLALAISPVFRGFGTEAI